MLNTDWDDESVLKIYLALRRRKKQKKGEKIVKLRASEIVLLPKYYYDD
jgi:hypothetical protein